MRVMVIVKASKESEAGEMPSEKLLADMGRFNEELVKAGVMLAGEGIHPTSRGKRVVFSEAGRRSSTDRSPKRRSSSRASGSGRSSRWTRRSSG